MNEEDEEKIRQVKAELAAAFARPFAPRRNVWHRLDENHNVVPCSLEEWARAYEKEEVRRVGYNKMGPYVVSTVFIGIDHSFGGGPPLWFETMIFSLKTGEARFFSNQTRYTTWEEAVEGHRMVVQLVAEGVLP
jgi:hypothetical protein